MNRDVAAKQWARACVAFRRADALYWAGHDPTEVPVQSTMSAWSSATRAAIHRAGRRNHKVSRRAAEPDFSPTRAALDLVLANDEPGYGREVRVMLVAIALREHDPDTAIRLCKKVAREGGDVSSELAWAHQQNGSRKGIIKSLAPRVARMSTVDAGYTAELQGDDATASARYLEMLAYPVGPFDHVIRIWQSFSRARLRRLETRLGKQTIAGEKAAQSHARNAGKIVIASVAEFHARFHEIAAAIRKREKIEEHVRPMSEAAIAKLRLPVSRSSRKPTVPVPPSIATILRTDRNFRVSADARPLLGQLKSLSIEKLVRSAVRTDENGLARLAKLPAKIPVWTDAHGMPACLSLASPGDQALLLYMGVRDKDGEYPLARFDDQPELWISDASLVHYLLNACSSVVTCNIDFEKATHAARKRNARFREGWSDRAEVAAILAKC
jgi:hypothetical protein